MVGSHTADGSTHSSEANTAFHTPTTLDRFRTASVASNEDGDTLGVIIFLTADDLAQFGVNPELADTVTYRVGGGDLRVNGNGDDGGVSP